MGLFEAELKHVVTLALFIPVVLALAESVGIQSFSLTLQLLHGKPLSWLAIFQKLHREFQVGLLLGGASGLAVGLVVLVWLHQMLLAVCVLGGIAAGVTGAAMLGMRLRRCSSRRTVRSWASVMAVAGSRVQWNETDNSSLEPRHRSVRARSPKSLRTGFPRGRTLGHRTMRDATR